MGIYLSVLFVILIIIFFAKKKDVSKRANKKLYTESNKELICTITKEAHQESIINEEIDVNPIIYNSVIETDPKNASEIYRPKIDKNNSNAIFTNKIKRLISERDSHLKASKVDALVGSSEIEDYGTADALGKKLIALEEKFQGLNSSEHLHFNHCSATTNKNKYPNNTNPRDSFKQKKLCIKKNTIEMLKCT
jgi:hypothetical protein